VKYIRVIKLKEELRDLEDQPKISKKDAAKIKTLKEEMEPLETFLKDAAEHRKQIKAEIRMMPEFELCVSILYDTLICIMMNKLLLILNSCIGSFSSLCSLFPY
jgi:hypothetical protein